MSDVGMKIKARRKALGLSVEELAEKAGMSRATMFRYENGGIDNVNLRKLTPIATALHTTPEYLMGWEEGLIPATRLPKEYLHDTGFRFSSGDGDIRAILENLLKLNDQGQKAVAAYIKTLLQTDGFYK